MQISRTLKRLANKLAGRPRGWLLLLLPTVTWLANCSIVVSRGFMGEFISMVNGVSSSAAASSSASDPVEPVECCEGEVLQSVAIPEKEHTSAPACATHLVERHGLGRLLEHGCG